MSVDDDAAQRWDPPRNPHREVRSKCEFAQVRRSFTAHPIARRIGCASFQANLGHGRGVVRPGTVGIEHVIFSARASPTASWRIVSIGNNGCLILRIRKPRGHGRSGKSAEIEARSICSRQDCREERDIRMPVHMACVRLFHRGPDGTFQWAARLRAVSCLPRAPPGLRVCRGRSARRQPETCAAADTSAR